MICKPCAGDGGHAACKGCDCQHKSPGECIDWASIYRKLEKK